jgi:hypothetical protein
MAAYDYVLTTGVIVADTSDTKAEVQQEFLDAFGDQIDLSDGTPQGVLINMFTAERDGVATNNATVANQINPNLAGGVFLDAIMGLSRAITGSRKQALPSTFTTDPDVTGAPGTIIPAGSKAETAEGDVFITTANVTIPPGGTISANFVSQETGEIPCAIGALNIISIGGVIGWETVNNTVSATLGQDQQSDPATRVFRNDTIALQGISVPDAIISGVGALDGVKSLTFRENVESFSQTIDGVLMIAHSIYVCVSGGDDNDIALELLEKKTMGAAYNGAVVVNVQDPESLQFSDVKFDRPAEIQIWIRVTIKPTTISNPEQVIIDAVLKYANGEIEGEKGFVVGGDVSPYEISGAINIETVGIIVTNVELSLNGADYFLATHPIEIFEIAITSASQILVQIA